MMAASDIAGETSTQSVPHDSDTDNITSDDPIYDPTLYKHVKRPAVHGPTAHSDIYCTTHTHFQRLYKHALQLLLHHQLHSIRIYGLGKAVEVAIQLAMKLQVTLTEAYVTLHPSTSTVVLYDDYLPLQPHLPPVTQCRYNSAICIRVQVKEQGNVPLALAVATGLSMPSVDFASTIPNQQSSTNNTDRKGHHSGRKHQHADHSGSASKKHKPHR